MWAHQKQVELRGLDVRSASLEEAFLRIARDAAGRGAGARDPDVRGADAPGAGVREQERGTAACVRQFRRPGKPVRVRIRVRRRPRGRWPPWRAELTLLGRSKATLAAAVFMPLLLPFSLRSTVDQMDLKGTGLSVGSVIVPSSVGFALLFAVYSPLVSVYAARRGARPQTAAHRGTADAKYSAGAALPSVAIGLVQCLVLTVACAALLDVGAPPGTPFSPSWGCTSAWRCRPAHGDHGELQQERGGRPVATMPLMLVSLFGSGTFFPLQLMPDQLASACELLPLTPVITLIRGGWTGDLFRARHPGRARDSGGLDRVRGVCCPAVVPLGAAALTTDLVMGMGGRGGWWRGEHTGEGRDVHTVVVPHLPVHRGRHLRAPCLRIRARPVNWILFLLVSAHAAVAAVTASLTLDWTPRPPPCRYGCSGR